MNTVKVPVQRGRGRPPLPDDQKFGADLHLRLPRQMLADILIRVQGGCDDSVNGYIRRAIERALEHDQIRPSL